MGLLFWIAFAAGRVVADSPEMLKAAAASVAAPEVTFKMTHLEGEPLIVRIRYLEEGTREIKVPPVPIQSPDAEASVDQSDHSQIVLITNTEDGVQGFAVEP